jgi:hypothetical protein
LKTPLAGTAQRGKTMSEIEYRFEELALIIEDGFEAALINGTATIGYHEDGEWSVREIALDGFRPRPKDDPCPLIGGMFERKPVALCRDSHPWLYGAIVDRLESEPRRSSIAEAVEQALEQERECAA